MFGVGGGAEVRGEVRGGRTLKWVGAPGSHAGQARPLQLWGHRLPAGPAVPATGGRRVACLTCLKTAGWGGACPAAACLIAIGRVHNALV